MELKITSEMEEEQTAAKDFLVCSENVVVRDVESYEMQCGLLKDCKKKWSHIEAMRKFMVKPIMDHVKSINNYFSEPLENLKRSECLIKEALVIYANQEEEKRKKEEQRLREEAAREQKKLREEAEKAEREAAKLKGKAAKEEREKKIEEAQDLKAEAEAMPLPVVEKRVEKVKGITYKEIWKYAVEDEKKIPRQYLLVDHKTLGSLARSAKGKVKVPGVKFYSEKSVAGSN